MLLYHEAARLFTGCTILLVFEDKSHALRPLRRQQGTTRGQRWTRPQRALWAFRMSQYNCHLLRTCTEGGPRACGWDERWHLLAYFRDICAMYQVNCESKGRHYYTVQHNEVCQLKHEFVGQKKQIDFDDLPTTIATVSHGVRGENKTTEWWWQGSTTNQYNYLQKLEVE